MTSPEMLTVAIPMGTAGLVAQVLEEGAAQRRIAAERAAGELIDGAMPGEDIRTPAVRLLRVLGEADQLQRAAATIREYAGGIHPAEVAVAAATDDDETLPAPPTPPAAPSPTVTPMAPPVADPSPQAAAPAAPAAPPERVSPARLRRPQAAATPRQGRRSKLATPPMDPRTAASLAAVQAAGAAAMPILDDEDEPALDDVVNVDLGQGTR